MENVPNRHIVNIDFLSRKCDIDKQFNIYYAGNLFCKIIMNTCIIYHAYSLNIKYIDLLAHWLNFGGHVEMSQYSQFQG